MVARLVAHGDASDNDGHDQVGSTHEIRSLEHDRWGGAFVALLYM